MQLFERNVKKLDFAPEMFLQKKINNKDVHGDYGATEYISEDTCYLRQRGDLAALWTEVGGLSFKH